jgi:hypothetical protein
VRIHAETAAPGRGPRFAGDFHTARNGQPSGAERGGQLQTVNERSAISITASSAEFAISVGDLPQICGNAPFADAQEARLFGCRRCRHIEPIAPQQCCKMQASDAAANGDEETIA